MAGKLIIKIKGCALRTDNAVGTRVVGFGIRIGKVSDIVGNRGEECKVLGKLLGPIVKNGI